MVWVGISMHTRSDLVMIPGNLNGSSYREEIVRPVILPHIAKNRGM